VLHLLQLILTTILGTLFFSNGVIPTDTRKCLLSNKWQDMWASHDADGIRRIQDAFNCCGLNSVKDRAWPFPEKGIPSQDACATQFHRTVSCAGPWAGAMQGASGAEFGVVVGVGVLQVCSLGIYFGQFQP
jgi:hypothetical protein